MQFKFELNLKYPSDYFCQVCLELFALPLCLIHPCIQICCFRSGCPLTQFYQLLRGHQESCLHITVIWCRMMFCHVVSKIFTYWPMEKLNHSTVLLNRITYQLISFALVAFFIDYTFCCWVTELNWSAWLEMSISSKICWMCTASHAYDQAWCQLLMQWLLYLFGQCFGYTHYFWEISCCPASCIVFI